MATGIFTITYATHIYDSCYVPVEQHCPDACLKYFPGPTLGDSALVVPG